MYSLPLVEMRQTPLVAATMKPVVAIGTVGRAMDAERNTAPEPEQSKIEHEHRAEERCDAEDVSQVDDAVGPDAGVAHGVAKGRTLEPHQQIGHVASDCATCDRRPSTCDRGRR